MMMRKTPKPPEPARVRIRGDSNTPEDGSPEWQSLISCRQCRWFDDGVARGYPGPISRPFSLCLHPSAEKFDRVLGWKPPVIRMIGKEDNKSLLDRCLAMNWFEEKPRPGPPWYMFWRTR